MDRVQVTTEKNTGVKAVWFNCPGCERWHSVPVTGPNAWTWNGSTTSPTLQPSLLSTWTEGVENNQRRCHIFIKDGKIQFLNDCLHDLKGQTVEMEEFNW